MLHPGKRRRTSCSSHLICTGGPGYDGPTGVGTPDGIGAFEPPAKVATSGEEGGEGEEAEAPAAKAPARGIRSGSSDLGDAASHVRSAGGREPRIQRTRAAPLRSVRCRALARR